MWWWLCCANSSALLSLLVVGCFECFGFTVKCVDASWLLEVGFYGFPFIAVTLDKNFVILGVQNLSFGRPGASISQPWGPFCQLEDTLGDHGSSRKDKWEPGTRFLLVLT